jgi:hypothetical protein
VPTALNVRGDPFSPDADAVTVFGPAAGPSVRVTEACPWLFDWVDDADREPPPPVTLHATLTPETPLPPSSVTRTTNGAPSSEPAVPDWPLPETSVIVVAVGGGPVPLPLSPSSPPQPTTIRMGTSEKESRERSVIGTSRAGPLAWSHQPRLPERNA